MKGSSGSNFDFVLTASRTESQRKLRVPGEVAPVGRMSFEVEKMREEIRAKSVPELKEILERQDRILNNSALTNKLPDKGEKARSKREIILQLLKDRERLEGLESQMKDMKIDTDKMEWKGRLLDSDDDSDPETDGPMKDPLVILAQGVVPTKSSKAKESEDNLPSNELELFAQKEVEMFDKIEFTKTFVPFKSTNSSIKDDELRKTLTDLKPKEEPVNVKVRRPTHRTPSIPLPSVYNCQTKKLSLADSLRLQQDHESKVREAQLKQAASRLVVSRDIKVEAELEDLTGVQFEGYRENTEDVNQEEEEEEEIDDDDEGQGVVGITQLVK